MEELALLFSFVSLIFTILIAVKDNELSLKISKMTFEFDLFKDIYKDHLTSRLPNARAQMFFSPDNKLQGIDDIIEELNSIRKDSLLFKFKNKGYYNELKNALMSLEDYIVTSEDNLFDEASRTAFDTNVEQHITNIYSIISRGYCGDFD